MHTTQLSEAETYELTRFVFWGRKKRFCLLSGEQPEGGSGNAASLQHLLQLVVALIIIMLDNY